MKIPAINVNLNKAKLNAKSLRIWFSASLLLFIFVSIFVTGGSYAAVVNCSSSAPTGNAKFIFSHPGGTSKVWLQVSTNQAQIEYGINNNSTDCVKELRDIDAPLRSTTTLQKFWIEITTKSFPIKQGNNEFTISSYNSEFSLYKVALVNDDIVPVADGSNVTTTS
jgi:hypothetical protein